MLDFLLVFLPRRQVALFISSSVYPFGFAATAALQAPRDTVRSLVAPPHCGRVVLPAEHRKRWTVSATRGPSALLTIAIGCSSLSEGAVGNARPIREEATL